MLPECLNDFKTINYVLQFWQQRGVLEMPRCRRNSCVERVLPSSQLQEGCSSSNRWNQSPSSIISHHQSHQPITSKVSSSASSIDQHQSQFQQLQEGCSSPNRLNQSPSSFLINRGVYQYMGKIKSLKFNGCPI